MYTGGQREENARLSASNLGRWPKTLEETRTQRLILVIHQVASYPTPMDRICAVLLICTNG